MGFLLAEKRIDNIYDISRISYCLMMIKLVFSPRHSNTGLVSSGVSLASWREDTSLALVGHPSRDGMTIKIPYVVDVLLR